MGGIGLGGSGMTATLNRAGETRAVINAFYKSDRANIKSRPRLMVKSGQQASIDVGNEIPVVTSTSQSTDVPGSPVIQTVTYRNTGVLLQIEPVVHSSGYVDIRISQELSEAQQTSTSSINSPTIFNRKLETTVTLRDGGSVLLGGLISETSSTSKNGVKGLGRLPGIGRLFRKDAKVTDKTELIMMVIPYIIENPDEAMKISDRALESLELTR
jgi:general secretion pathway protein D